MRIEGADAVAFSLPRVSQVVQLQGRYDTDLQGLIELRLEHAEAKERISDLEVYLATKSKPKRK